MKKYAVALALTLAVLTLASPASATTCTAPRQIYATPVSIWEYLASNDFACSPDPWFYSNSSKGTSGICSNIWGVTNFTQLGQAYPSTDRTYQVVHIPSTSTETGYSLSNNWTVAFSYETSGTGSWWDTVEIRVYDNDTGSQIYASSAIHGDTLNSCTVAAYNFTSNLNGKNVRVEVRGLVQTSGFAWKVTNVSLQRQV